MSHDAAGRPLSGSLSERLDAALTAVRCGTTRADVLVALYEEAAAQSDDAVQRGFFLTHAYVHALESGDPRAATLKAQLQEMGRET